MTVQQNGPQTVHNNERGMGINNSAIARTDSMLM